MGIIVWMGACGDSRRVPGVAVAPRARSGGRSFLADHEVDCSAQVLLGAVHFGPCPEGGGLLLDESLYLFGEDEFFWIGPVSLAYYL